VADRLHRQKDSPVVHGRNSAIKTGCGTTDFQRAVSSVLTVCLSRGDHFTKRLPSGTVLSHEAYCGDKHSFGNGVCLSHAISSWSPAAIAGQWRWSGHSVIIHLCNDPVVPRRTLNFSMHPFGGWESDPIEFLDATTLAGATNTVKFGRSWVRRLGLGIGLIDPPYYRRLSPANSICRIPAGLSSDCGFCSRSRRTTSNSALDCCSRPNFLYAILSE